MEGTTTAGEMVMALYGTEAKTTGEEVAVVEATGVKVGGRV